MEITTSEIWFINPVNNQKLYLFVDVPHLFKLLRNHIVDNDTEIGKTIIEKFLKITSSTDFNIAHKMSLLTKCESTSEAKSKVYNKAFLTYKFRGSTRCGMLGNFNDEPGIKCVEFFKDVNYIN